MSKHTTGKKPVKKIPRAVRWKRPNVTMKIAIDPAVKRAFVRHAKKSTFISAGFIVENLMTFLLTDRAPGMLIEAGTYRPNLSSRDRRAKMTRSRLLYESIASPDGGCREAAAAAYSPPPTVPPPRLNAAYAMRNVLAFASDIRALQERAWAYANIEDGLDLDRELVQPLEDLIRTVMGKVASQFVGPLEMTSMMIEEIKATELLAGVASSVPQRHAG